jgi:poly-gamma-glutamate synthesis protein (capsule biosynthesis protein)
MAALHKKSKKFTLITFFLLIFQTSCTENPINESKVFDPTYPASGVSQEQTLIPEMVEETDFVVNGSPSIWLDPIVSSQFEDEKLGISESLIITDKQQANYWVETTTSGNSDLIIYEQLFVLSVPFISQFTNFSFEDLQQTWLTGQHNGSEIFIWVNSKEFVKLKEIMGEKGGENVILSEEKPALCEEQNCLRICDFLDIDPQWRIIPIDNNSPLSKQFDSERYPLFYRIGVNQNPLVDNEHFPTLDVEKKTNFNPSKLTSILVTGTTALVRNTAFQIEQNGYSFPYLNIQDLLKSVDLVHISNEVPFYSNCPPAVPVRPEMRFCSDPEYVNILLEMGTDIVELTGNHLLDWGEDAFLETLTVYDENDIQYYGGGINEEEAKQPLKYDHNGNKFAFLGCNVTGPENNWATEDEPGSLKCNLNEMEEIIRDLKQQGFNVIFTFQHFEFNTFRAVKQMQDDFWRIAQAGADIVSGSQAHYPHGIDFVESSFIHYGLGNFLFDQMYTYWGMATIDIHYFYENEYINTEQIAIINENYGQPRIMTLEERELLLNKIYSNSFYYEKSEQ